MKRFIRILTVCFLVSPLSSWAQSNPFRLFPTLSCPSIGEDYEELLMELESLKSTIKSEANCDETNDQVASLEQLLGRDRQAIMNIVNRDPATPITAAEAQTVQHYAENVTQRVANIYEMLANRGECFSSDRPQRDWLSTLSGIAGDVSSVAAKVAGPWGTPISIAGNVVAGFLSGLGKVLNSQAAYDFRDRDQWMSYVNHLCTYYEYREQIDHLLDPSGRIDRLQDLKVQAELQVEELSRSCNDCLTVRNLFEAQPVNGEDIAQLTQHARDADQNIGQPLATYTLQGLGIKRWAEQEIVRIEQEAESNWGNVTGRFLLSEIKTEIEQFLIIEQAPRFLSYQFGISRQKFREFEDFTQDEGRPLYFDMMRNYPGLVNVPVPVNFAGYVYLPPLGTDYFYSLVIAPLNWNILPNDTSSNRVRMHWANYRDGGIEKFLRARDTLLVLETFCEFFSFSGYYLLSNGIEHNCGRNEVLSLIAREQELEYQLIQANVRLRTPREPLRDPHGQIIEEPALDHLDALTRTIQSRRALTPL